jgi:hypothetical protein
MPAETADAEPKKCDFCNRELRSASEWICSDQHVICDTCYQNLLDPDKKISFEV